jgi:hexosaminidase
MKRLPLFALLAAAAFAQAPAPSILPKPSSLELLQGSFRLGRNTSIVTDRETASVGKLLSRTLSPATGYTLKVRETGQAANKSIILLVDPSLAQLGSEGYSLEVTPQRVTIRAPQPAGVFYGTETLRQLMPPEVYSHALRKKVAWRVPCVRIEDQPRFNWRGAHLDVSRHFMPKQFVLKFIDLLAIQKMNVLQLHLTDDQGWRIEIKKYPLLTQVGSVRKETLVGRPRDKQGYDGKPHAGFYSQEDIREIVQYAGERFVTVVPEIEMPGHAQAAMAAYPELGNTSEKLEVKTDWGVNKHVLNVNEKTILFLQDVLDEVLALFPSQFIHVGGDEVPLDEWKASTEAQARIKELELNSDVELHGYVIRRMDQFLTSRGRRLIGWDEILEGGLAPGATVMSWRGIKGGITAAKAGHDVVMTPTSHTYFDYYQAKDPEEPLAIGGFTPLEKVYQYEPIPPDLSDAEAARVLGTQGQLWTEYIGTPEQLEYMAFPRLLALAEVAWTPAAQKDYKTFLERLRVQERRWRALGVNFRPLT